MSDRQTRRPRAYRPKARGCFQCSKRRIDCDRGEPRCAKCQSKGLACSGLGVRYRFNAGVASRGRWKGKDYYSDEISVTQHRSAVMPQRSQEVSFVPVLLQEPSTLSATTTSLLLHFSQHIACEMVVIDGRHNGWRHLVLPIAHTDELVLKAVLAAASFHAGAKRQAENHVQDLADAESLRFYHQTLKELQKRTHLATSDEAMKLSVLLTYLVLLVAVMVTGSNDFPALFGLLEIALTAMGGEASLGKSELASFILRQIHKLRFYAAPQLSERAGLMILSSPQQVNRSFECIRHCLEQQPGHLHTVSIVESLIQQSRDIYLHQAAHGRSDLFGASAAAESVARIERYKHTITGIPAGSPGAQVLIWATFMAAPDCVLPEHQAFFTKVLEQYYQRSRFANIRRGLDHLRSIWQQRSDTGVSWIPLLPQAKVLVM